MNLNFAIRVKFSNNLHEEDDDRGVIIIIINYNGGWERLTLLVMIWGRRIWGVVVGIFSIYHRCCFFFLQFLDLFPEFFCTKIDII